MSGWKCSIHGKELEEVRPGKWLCPDPECTSCVTARQMEQFRDLAWAQANGMVHPDATVIGGGAPHVPDDGEYPGPEEIEEFARDAEGLTDD